MNLGYWVIDGLSAAPTHCSNLRGAQAHLLNQIFISIINSQRALIHKFWLYSSPFPLWFSVVHEVHLK